MSADKYTQYALAALKERGIQEPSQELLRLELVYIHLEEAACLASLIGQKELAKGIQFHLLRVRIQRSFAERFSVIAPAGRT